MKIWETIILQFHSYVLHVYGNVVFSYKMVLWMVKDAKLEKGVTRLLLSCWALKCLHMLHKEQIMKLTLPEPPLETSKKIMLYFLNDLYLIIYDFSYMLYSALIRKE